MHHKILEAVKALGHFSNEHLEVFAGCLQKRSFEKGEMLLELGEICQHLWFLEQGSVRQYHVNDNLDEVIVGLFVPGHWVLDHLSFTGQKPSTDHLQAFEDCEVIAISIHDLHELIGQSPAYFQLGKILEQVQRTPFDRDASPDDRYLQLMENNPSLIQKFPLKQIASYLGMTPETLSRIRNRIR